MHKSLKIARQIIVLASIIIMIAINIVAEIIPLNNQTVAQISDSYHTFFVPAGYVFAIWGLIYLGLIAYGIYQALPKQRDGLWYNLLGIWVVIGCIANSLWIFLWHYNHPALALVAMFILLVSLVEVYLRFGIGTKKVGPWEKLFVHLPFSIYLGWITVATIANIAVVLYVNNFDLFNLGGELMGTIMVIVAGLITSFVIWFRRDIAYALVVVWALIGIYVKFKDYEILPWTCVFVIAIIFGVALLQPLAARRLKSKD